MLLFSFSTYIYIKCYDGVLFQISKYIVQLLMRSTDMFQWPLSTGDEWYHQTLLRQCLGFLPFWIHGAWPSESFSFTSAIDCMILIPVRCNFAQLIIMAAWSRSSKSNSEVNRVYYEKHRAEISCNKVKCIKIGEWSSSSVLRKLFRAPDRDWTCNLLMTGEMP